jgi:tetratricopeptide (TPR) repeat protein
MRIFFFFIAWLCILTSSCDQKSTTNKKEAYVDTSRTYISCSPADLTDNEWYSSGKKAPLFSGLEGVSFPITTKNAETQKYFNQGLMLSFGFNHTEAARSFFEGGRQDSTAAMCWWGLAYVLGRNYNSAIAPGNIKPAYDAIQKAKSIYITCTQKEKDLIEALTYRYSIDTSIAHQVLDSSYAVAMERVYKKYPNDTHVASLYAESLMNLHPWKIWKKDGTIQPWTSKIITVLEKCLQIEPNHAGANHLYIHAMEASKYPEKALASAARLRDLVPGVGHLVHMPSHIYIRTGRYHDGVVANLKAISADSSYIENCYAQNIYPFLYYPHNYHFVAACATLAGESKKAVKAAHEIVGHANKKVVLDKKWEGLQSFYSIRWYVEVKLGLWNQILQSAPDKELKYPTAIWHYAQGMANLSYNKIPAAKEHLSKIKVLLADSNSTSKSNLQQCVIASKTLEGEINAKEKNYSTAIIILKKAVALEDSLNYAEPPIWPFSVRHNLGAVLLEAQQYKEAIHIYQEDLKNYPENGWALRGLMNAYEKIGYQNKYKQTKDRFKKAWKHADVAISSSRIM